MLKKKALPRLPNDAYIEEEIEQYYATRSLEFLYDNFHWVKKITSTSFGYVSAFIKEGEIYYSVLAHDNAYAKKEYNAWLFSVKNKEVDIKEILNLNSIQKATFRQLKDSFKIVAAPGSREYLWAKEFGFHEVVVAQTVEGKLWPEYEAIKKFYGNQVAKRTQIHLMNHIDEGLYILKEIKASISAQKAFCLHPLYQGDNELAQFLKPEIIEKFCPMALALALEYRSVANEYLSRRVISSIEEIRLSPMKEVNDMLVADKIQNYKDFSLYHFATHPRSKELESYFINWFQKLGVSHSMYNDFFYNLRHQHLLNAPLTKKI